METEKKLAEATNDCDPLNMKKFKQRTTKVTKEHIDEVTELLTALGIPWIQSIMEAEAQCAYMAKAKVVNCVATTDTDAIVLGSPIILMNFKKKTTYTKTEIVKVDYAEILATLKWNAAQVFLCSTNQCV